MKMSILSLSLVLAVVFGSYRFGFDRGVDERFSKHATGRLAENGIQARIRVVAADTLDPVKGAEFKTILIGEDGGDGGFSDYTTGADGSILTTEYLFPGRYQIYIEPPKHSRFVATQFHQPETYLVVRSDGTYSPVEFKMATKETERERRPRSRKT